MLWGPGSEQIHFMGLSMDFTDVMVFKIALFYTVHSQIVQACRACSVVKSTFQILIGEGLGYKLRQSNGLL